MKTKTITILCSILLASGCFSSSDVDVETHERIVKSRLWLNMDDIENGQHIEAFALLKARAGNRAYQGVRIEVWEFRTEQEIFKWMHTDGADPSYEFIWPHQGINTAPKVKAWECEESDENEFDFDLCMTVQSDQFKNQMFYSNWDMIVEANWAQGTVDAFLRGLDLGKP